MIWGGLHGGMLAFERRFFRQPDNTIRYPVAAPRVVWVGIVFVVVLLGWVFFRATDLPHAGHYLASMFGAGHPQPGASLVGGILYRPYYLLSISVAARGGVVRAADLGMDATADPAAGCRVSRARLDRARGAGHAGVQSVHLLHLLMAEPETERPREPEHSLPRYDEPPLRERRNRHLDREEVAETRPQGHDVPAGGNAAAHRGVPADDHGAGHPPVRRRTARGARNCRPST